MMKMQRKWVVTYRDITGASRIIEGDLVIATDGPSSRIRQVLQSDVGRKYMGYCGWRGTVPERELSKES